MTRITCLVLLAWLLAACGAKTDLFAPDGDGGAGAAGTSTHGSTNGVTTHATTVGVTTHATTVGVTTVGVTTHATTVGVTTGITTAVVSSSSGMPVWTCNLAYYGSMDGCDCGCGSVDPDCNDTLVSSCVYCNDPGSCNGVTDCPGLINPNFNAICTLPEDCSNGADDDGDGSIDCADPDCMGMAMCPPASWTCFAGFYGASDGCDCGCGSFDPDCPDANVVSCVFCDDNGSCNGTPGCPGTIEPTHNSTCMGMPIEDCNNGLDDDGNGFIDCADFACLGQPGCAPMGWTCPPFWYNEGNMALCDCGCGVHDPDCVDNLVGTCNFCDDSGSCTGGMACPANIVPTNNAVCF